MNLTSILVWILLWTESIRLDTESKSDSFDELQVIIIFSDARIKFCVPVSLTKYKMVLFFLYFHASVDCGETGVWFCETSCLEMCEHAFPACYWATVPPTVKFWLVIEDCCDLCPNPSLPTNVSDDAYLFIMLLCLPNLVRFTDFLEVFMRDNFICLDFLTASVSKAKQIWNPTGWRLAVRTTGLFDICCTLSLLDIDECVVRTHNCGVGFQCQNTDGSFTCNLKQRCLTGFTQDSHGNCIGKTRQRHL